MREGELPRLLAAALVLAVGYGALELLGLRRRADPLGWWAWCWVAGSALVAALFLLLCALPVVPTPAVAAGAPLALAAALLTVARRRGGAGPEPPPRGARAGRAALLLALGAALALFLLRAWTSAWVPAALGDEGAIWAPKAKALFLWGTERRALTELVRGELFGAHPDYPWFDPLLQAWAHALAGELTVFDQRVPVQLFVPALLVAVAAGARRAAGPWVAAALVLAVGASRELEATSKVAMADAMLAACLAVTLDALARWRATGERAWLRLAVLAATALAWTKHDALLHLAGIGAGLVVVARARGGVRELRPALPGAALVAAVPLATLVAARGLGLRYELAAGAAPGLARFEEAPIDPLARLGEVVPAVLDAALFDRAWTSWIALAGLLLLPLAARRLRRGEDFALPFAHWATFACGMVGVYALTPRVLEWHLGTSADRVLFQALPAAALWTAALLARALEPER